MIILRNNVYVSCCLREEEEFQTFSLKRPSNNLLYSSSLGNDYFMAKFTS